MKRNRIKGLSLDELSVVDAPANPGAQIALFKRQEPKPKTDEGENVMFKTLEEALAAFEEQKTELAKANDAVAVLTKALESTHDVKKAEDGAVTVVAKAKEEMIEFEGEMIAKSAVPAPILKALEKQAKEVADLRKAAETEDLRKRAEKEFPNLAGSADEKAALMKAVDGIDASAKEAVVKSLKAADAAVSKLFKEVGSAQVDETSPQAQLNKLAKEYADKNKVSFEAAFSEVTRNGAGLELYKALRSSK